MFSEGLPGKCMLSGINILNANPVYLSILNKSLIVSDWSINSLLHNPLGTYHLQMPFLLSSRLQVLSKKSPSQAVQEPESIRT